MSAPALDLAGQIEAAHTAAIGAARTAIDHAVACGKLLIEAKAKISHGGWLSWVDQHLTFGHRQAQKYIRLAESKVVANANSNSHLTIDGALAAIAEPARKPNRTKVKPKWEPANPKPEEKPVEHPADPVIAAVRDINIRFSPKSLDTAVSVMTDDQRADLRQHLPDVIEKLGRLAGPVAVPADEVVEDQGDEEGDPFAGLPRPKRTSRPKRWAEACQQAMAALEELQELQGEYQDMRQNVPENLEGSAFAEKLDAIEDLDIEGAISIVQEIEDADLPLGFGRD